MAARSALSNEEIARYSRQLILPEWGVAAQLKVKAASVLIVGAGGLGCPAAQYLAAAGIGHIGILDYDEVEISNLHRQVLHSEGHVGIAKVESIQESINSLNSSVQVSKHCTLLTSENALDILKQYDIIVDASDNVATRYLVNDGCVLLNKPLVSGSALRFEGQLTVYHHGDDGPCYRCLFPSPPPPNMVTNCSEGGVLGVIPGIIGSMQALEVLKIVTGIGDTYSGRLLMFDGLSNAFHTIKLRSRDPSCDVCGDTPSITELIDYQLFCGSSANDKERGVTMLDRKDRITCWEYKNIVDEGVCHLLIDVREPVEYEICHLDNSHNIPLKSIEKSAEPLEPVVKMLSDSQTPLYVVCRRGNDSQIAVGLIRASLAKILPTCLVSVKDLIGGLRSWSDSVDNSFPKY